MFFFLKAFFLISRLQLIEQARLFSLEEVKSNNCTYELIFLQTQKCLNTGDPITVVMVQKGAWERDLENVHTISKCAGIYHLFIKPLSERRSPGRLPPQAGWCGRAAASGTRCRDPASSYRFTYASAPALAGVAAECPIHQDSIRATSGGLVLLLALLLSALAAGTCVFSL